MVQTAQTDNSKHQKLYFVDFYTDWCGWCKRMDRETFTDPTVAKILNTYYIPTKFDAEGADTFVWRGKEYKGTPTPRGARKQAHSFAHAILGQQMGFPSFAIFRPNQQLMTVVPGYSTANDFAVILWYFASGDCDRYAFEQYQKIFDKEIRPVMKKQLNIK